MLQGQANLIGTVTMTNDPVGTQEKARVKARTKLEIASVADSKRHIGVSCPYKWTNSIDEEDDQGSSWEE